MCLTVYPKHKRAVDLFVKGQIAKKDIIVYKILKKSPKGKFLSPYREMTYTPGFHYYQTGKNGIKIKVIENIFFNETRVEITTGLHAYITKKAAQEWLNIYPNQVVVEMIIPKGAKIWISKEDKEIVSTDLIFPHQ